MKILILGFSRSGKSAYELLKEKHQVFIYDKVKLDLPNYISYSNLKKDLPYFDLVIRSPGIKITSKVYQLVNQLTKRIISEIELGLKYIKNNKIIGVTGSNGKTTLVNMIHFLLKDKFVVHKLGNIGTPLTSKVNQINRDDIVVLELSSFQLENTYSKVFDIGVVTNILDNHFDSVFSKEGYIASKLKLLNLSKKVYSEKKYQKRRKNIKNINNLPLFFNAKLNKYNHVYWNIACDIALSFGIKKEDIINKQYEFEMEHYRMEKIKDVGGLTFINDSKSTSISATNACLDIYSDKKRIIILGGISKKEKFTKINKKQNDIVISYGREKLKIFNQIGDFYFNDLSSVMNYIKRKYKKDYYIIFSPGCSSLDQYKSYIKRGEEFNQLINIFF